MIPSDLNYLNNDSALIMGIIHKESMNFLNRFINIILIKLIFIWSTFLFIKHSKQMTRIHDNIDIHHYQNTYLI